MGFCYFFSEPVDIVCGREGKKDNFQTKCFFCLDLKRAQKSKHLSVSFLILFLILIKDQRLKVI